MILKKEEEDSLDDESESVRRIPINQPPTGYLNTEDLVQSSMDTAISSDNIGYKLLQKMGWTSGSALGRNGTGMFRN